MEGLFSSLTGGLHNCRHGDGVSHNALLKWLGQASSCEKAPVER